MSDTIPSLFFPTCSPIPTLPRTPFFTAIFPHVWLKQACKHVWWFWQKGTLRCESHRITSHLSLELYMQMCSVCNECNVINSFFQKIGRDHFRCFFVARKARASAGVYQVYVRHFMACCVGETPAPGDGAKARWHVSRCGKSGGVKPISQRDTSRPREEKALSLESYAYNASLRTSDGIPEWAP